jgi:hypothetical protein
MRRARPAAILLALLCAAGLSACGHLARVPAHGVLYLTLQEYRLAPGSARVQAGPLTIHVRNLGRLSHNLAVSDGRRTVAATHPIPPGGAAWFELLLAPGTYQMGSSLFSDQDLGLYGTLTVVRGGAGKR